VTGVVPEGVVEPDTDRRSVGISGGVKFDLMGEWIKVLDDRPQLPN
jgi:hypothetical protein